MIRHAEYRGLYFQWLIKRVYDKRNSRHNSYMRLLEFLHKWIFVWTVGLDANRAADGLELRTRCEEETGFDCHFDIPCSVLEMMVALAVRCEDQLMWDPDRGDRAGLWFWTMIVNLGLGGMTDEFFDEEYAGFAVRRFLNREYDAYGNGGLFIVKNPMEDMREVDIWQQMNWCLGELTRQDW